MTTEENQPCKCWEETDEKLKPRGVKLSDALSALSFSRGTVVRLLPLGPVEGKKLKRDDPKNIEMSFCPFCGQKF